MNRRLYPCIVLLMMVVCSSGSINRDYIREPSTITFSDGLMKRYPNIVKLIRDSLSKDSSLYQFPVFALIKKYGQHGLHFDLKSMAIEQGGETNSANAIIIKGNVWIKNNIVLNSTFLERGCREYIVQVIIHESMHAFIKWSKAAYKNNVKNVDLKYLNTFFHNNKEWFTLKTKMTDTMEHILMYRNFFDVMKNCIRIYTNPELNTFRDSIAQSLAWGGLEQHVPEWKLQPDTCMMSCINIAAVNFNPPPGGETLDPPPCETNGNIMSFLNQTKGFFRLTKPQ